MRVVELGNADNWESLYSTERVARTLTLSNGKVLIERIPFIEIPFTLEKFILAVEIKTEVPEGGDWWFAGRIYQRVRTGLVVGGGQDAVSVRSKVLSLEQVNLVLFDKISTSYSISIRVPKYFTLAIVNVWQYIGIDDDSLAIQTAQELANVNFKLDQILSRNQ